MGITDDAETIDKERFVESTTTYYRCVKPTLFSEDISLKAKSVRRLNEDEVMIHLEGPTKADIGGVERGKCKAISDNAEGWVTLQGNQGALFLIKEGNFITVAKKVKQDKEAAEAKLAAEKAAAERKAVKEAEWMDKINLVTQAAEEKRKAAEEASKVAEEARKAAEEASNAAEEARKAEEADVVAAAATEQKASSAE